MTINPIIEEERPKLKIQIATNRKEKLLTIY